MADKTSFKDLLKPKSDFKDTLLRKSQINEDDDGDEGGGGAGKKHRGDYKKEKLRKLVDRGTFKAEKFKNFFVKDQLDEHELKKTDVTKDVSEKAQNRVTDRKEKEAEKKHLDSLTDESAAKEDSASEWHKTATQTKASAIALGIIDTNNQQTANLNDGNFQQQKVNTTGNLLKNINNKSMQNKVFVASSINNLLENNNKQQQHKKTLVNKAVSNFLDNNVKQQNKSEQAKHLETETTNSSSGPRNSSRK